MALDDDMLLAIALQACLPMLASACKPTTTGSRWSCIRAISSSRDTVDEAAGVLHEYDDEVLGEGAGRRAGADRLVRPRRRRRGAPG